VLSNIIIDTLEGYGLELTKATNLFAEQGRGDQHVVVSTGSPTNPVNTLEFLRRTPVNIIVTGWAMKDGWNLAEDICRAVAGMLGEYYYDENELYTVLGVEVVNYPTLLKAAENITFTMNFIVTYRTS
jgi:hypothetical protein